MRLAPSPARRAGRPRRVTSARPQSPSTTGVHRVPHSGMMYRIGILLLLRESRQCGQEKWPEAPRRSAAAADRAQRDVAADAWLEAGAVALGPPEHRRPLLHEGGPALLEVGRI